MVVKLAKATLCQVSDSTDWPSSELMTLTLPVTVTLSPGTQLSTASQNVRPHMSNEHLYQYIIFKIKVELQCYITLQNSSGKDPLFSMYKSDVKHRKTP